MGFRSDPFVLVPIAPAVLRGGFGFPVLFELGRQLRAAASCRARRGSLSTLLVLSATAVVLPVAYALLVSPEWSSAATPGPLSPGHKLGTGVFETVVSRSAGFSTPDGSELRTSSLIVLDVLMFVGSGPGGTAGGIKLTTAAVLLFVIVAEARGEEAVTAFRRRIPAAVVSLSVSLLATGTVVLATLVVTVVGRPGSITVATALALRSRPRRRLYAFPTERPIIG